MSNLDHIAVILSAIGLVLVATSSLLTLIRIRAMASHEHAHCLQLGELQHVVALTAEHFAGMTAGPLPEPVAEFVAEVGGAD